MDQRGFGQSDGERGFIDRSEDIYDDQFLFIYSIVKEFKLDIDQVPFYLIGKSFGGLISLNL